MAAPTMDLIVSLCKRRGFIFPSSEVYGGFASTWDYGPLGSELKRNVKDAWWRRVVWQRPDVEGIDAAILMAPRVWVASGHVESFSDPLVECKNCHHRFRLDLLEEMRCLECGGTDLTEPRQFNMMFRTFVGPVEDEAAVGGKGGDAKRLALGRDAAAAGRRRCSEIDRPGLRVLPSKPRIRWRLAGRVGDAADLVTLALRANRPQADSPRAVVLTEDKFSKLIKANGMRSDIIFVVCALGKPDIGDSFRHGGVGTGAGNNPFVSQDTSGIVAERVDKYLLFP